MVFQVTDSSGRVLERYISRREILATLQISSGTVKRYVRLLSAECPDFEYKPYSEEFTEYQFKAIETLRQWYKARLKTEQIRERLRKEGLP